MQIKSLYLSSQERGAGTLFISFGMMEILKKNIQKVAFFRPIILSEECRDKDIDFMLEYYDSDMEYEDSYGVDKEYAERMIAAGRLDELVNLLIGKFERLQRRYDFILCEGIRRSFLTATLDFDLNMFIAQNLGAPIINIISAKEKSFQEVYEEILIESENIRSHECAHFATFVNRLNGTDKSLLQKKLQKNSVNIYFLQEVQELDIPTVEDVIDALHAEKILFSPNDKMRAVRGYRIAAQSVECFLRELQEEDLVILPADRSDIVAAIVASFYSKDFPKISGALFTSQEKLDANMYRMLKGLQPSLPLLSVQTDIFKTLQNLLKVYPKLRVTNKRKIALALGLFHRSVDHTTVEAKIAAPSSDIMTPMMFEYKLFDAARQKRKKIVLPESSDERILRAAEIILRRDAADIILLAKKEEIEQNIQKLGLDLSKATLLDHTTSDLFKKFAEEFYTMRKDKGVTRAAAYDTMAQRNYFATMMVHLGYADAMVSGAVHATADTIRPALQIIKTKPGVRIVSTLFFMCFRTKVFVYGDCALNQNPDAKDLAQIAISCAQTAAEFGIDPKVAMLSYSTGESGSGSGVNKVREATNIIKSLRKDLKIEGPIQYDAAVDKSVASIKIPNSKVAGEATVFIFPDLNTGNNTYKAVQRSSGAVAIGPILQGLKKPVNDLSRGCSVKDIVNTVLITAIQAAQS